MPGAAGVRQPARTRYSAIMLPTLAAGRDWFDVATGLAQIVTALAIVAVAVFAAGTAWAIRAATRGMAKALEGAQGELVPLLKQARGIADDVKGMTAAAAGEVARVRALVEATTGKAEAALEAAEARLKRLDALAGIIQDEAERTVVTVASTVRGTSAALASLREGLTGMPSRTRDRPDDVDDDADDDADDDFDDAFEDELDDDTPPATAVERPRVRPPRR
jgi:uncharacterized protein YoxC